VGLEAWKQGKATCTNNLELAVLLRKTVQSTRDVQPSGDDGSESEGEEEGEEEGKEEELHCCIDCATLEADEWVEHPETGKQARGWRECVRVRGYAVSEAM
jgi:hypothetical protein